MFSQSQSQNNFKNIYFYLIKFIKFNPAENLPAYANSYLLAYEEKPDNNLPYQLYWVDEEGAVSRIYIPNTGEAWNTFLNKITNILKNGEQQENGIKIKLSGDEIKQIKLAVSYAPLVIKPIVSEKKTWTHLLTLSQKIEKNELRISCLKESAKISLANGYLSSFKRNYIFAMQLERKNEKLKTQNNKKITISSPKQRLR